MAILRDEDRESLREAFADNLVEQVTLAMFTYSEDSPEYDDCQFCAEMEQLLEEFAELSDLIELVVYDFEKDVELRDRYGVERAPSLVILGDEDYGIRYYGIPSGYEAQSLVGDIVDVSKRDSELSEDTLNWLGGLEQSVHLQVFVTPT